MKPKCTNKYDCYFQTIDLKCNDTNMCCKYKKFTIEESSFFRDQQCDGNIIRIAECPNCRGVVTYGVGCNRCNSEFNFK